jgi:hypothetical protein
MILQSRERTAMPSTCRVRQTPIFIDQRLRGDAKPTARTVDDGEIRSPAITQSISVPL